MWPIMRDRHLKRFYTSAFLSQATNTTELQVCGRAAHHIAIVLRMKIGQPIRVFHEQAGEWIGTIKALEKGPVILLQLQTRIADVPQPLRPLHLAFGLLKWDAMHMLLEKSVEFGVTHLHPLLLDHCHCRQFSADKSDAVMVDAAQQCERMDIPVMHSPLPLSVWLQRCHPIDNGFDTVIWSWAKERAVSKSLIDVFDRDITCMGKPLGVVIGPEGGWSSAECQLLNAMPSYTLGPRILRSETAALASLAILQSIWCGQ
jgi:16S rRNA (uracil1498-N3)-methyltransferase